MRTTVPCSAERLDINACHGCHYIRARQASPAQSLAVLSGSWRWRCCKPARVPICEAQVAQLTEGGHVGRSGLWRALCLCWWGGVTLNPNPACKWVWQGQQRPPERPVGGLRACSAPGGPRPALLCQHHPSLTDLSLNPLIVHMRTVSGPNSICTALQVQVQSPPPGKVAEPIGAPAMIRACPLPAHPAPHPNPPHPTVRLNQPPLNTTHPTPPDDTRRSTAAPLYITQQT